MTEAGAYVIAVEAEGRLAAKIAVSKDYAQCPAESPGREGKTMEGGEMQVSIHGEALSTLVSAGKSSLLESPRRYMYICECA